MKHRSFISICFGLLLVLVLMSPRVSLLQFGEDGQSPLSINGKVQLTDAESSTDSTLQMAYSEAIGNDDSSYHFGKNGDGYTASNINHNLRIDVSGDGLTISVDNDTWQLFSEKPAEKFSTEGNRLTIHWDGYDEWYVNGPIGVQQGFTLYQPSDISFDIGGTLTTTATAQSLDIDGRLTFSGLMAYDAIGQDVPVAFNVKYRRLDYVYDDSKATYPLTIDPWVQQAKVTASDGLGGEYFGHAVTLEGYTAIVGAPLDDAGRGSAYIFVRNGTTWSQQAKLVPDNGYAQFGFSVDLSGETALIGAVYDDNNGSADGSAYVFVRNGTIWSQQAKLESPDATGADAFGVSVSLDNDTAVVGAAFDDSTGLNSGSAYVFVRNGTTWSQQAKLVAPDGSDSDLFGWSVAIDEDTALIGAPEDDVNATDTGSAYVFTRVGTTWLSTVSKLTRPDWTSGDEFGYSVALSGDTALIGAWLDDNNGTDSGSAYVFVRAGSIWSQQAILLPSDGSPGDVFGISVALDGDIALVGAVSDDDNGSLSGSAYIFRKLPWTQEAKLLATDGASGDRFGFPVALSGNTALIGAPWDDDNGIDSGSAYVFQFEPVTFPLNTNAVCQDEDLIVMITDGDEPFDITSSAASAPNVPRLGVVAVQTTIDGPGKWDDLTVTETNPDYESVNLGNFKCRPSDIPTPLTPAHGSHTTDITPTFTWTSIPNSNDYRVWVFDDPDPVYQTVSIFQNSGGPTFLTLSTPLSPSRYFWRVRGRVNNVWSLWSIRFTLFVDPLPVEEPSVTPTPTVEPSPTVEGTDIAPPNDRIMPTPFSTLPPVATPTLSAPPNSR